MGYKRNSFPTSGRGFSLIELMVALAIAAVMLTYAIPAFNDFTSQRRMASNVNMLVSAVNYARSEAARQGGVVTVQAEDAADAGDEWGPGFCVTLGDPGDCDAPLAYFAPEGGATFDALNGLNNVDGWSFNSRGMLTNPVAGEVQICGGDAGDDPGRILRLNAIGRASVDQMVCFP